MHQQSHSGWFLKSGKRVESTFDSHDLFWLDVSDRRTQALFQEDVWNEVLGFAGRQAPAKWLVPELPLNSSDLLIKSEELLKKDADCRMGRWCATVMATLYNYYKDKSFSKGGHGEKFYDCIFSRIFDTILSGTGYYMDRGELESPSEKRYRNISSEINIRTPRYDGLVKKHIEIESPEAREYAFWESAKDARAQQLRSSKRKTDELKMITGMVISLESLRPSGYAESLCSPKVGDSEFLRTCLVSVFTAGLQIRLIYCTPGLGTMKLVNRRNPVCLPKEYERKQIRQFLQEVVLFLA